MNVWLQCLEGPCGGLTLASCQVLTKLLYHSPLQPDSGEKNMTKGL